MQAGLAAQPILSRREALRPCILLLTSELPTLVPSSHCAAGCSLKASCSYGDVFIFFSGKILHKTQYIYGAESASVLIQCGVLVPLCDKSRGCKGKELRSEFVTVTVDVEVRLGKGWNTVELSLK